jgi:biotin carboxylase
VVAVWTLGFLECTDVDSHLPQALGDKPIAYQAHIHQTAQDTLETVSRRIKESLRPGQQVAACLAGDEFGVDCADQLSDYLGLETSNGVQIPNRRSKKAQQELIHRAGLRSIRQAGGTSLKDPAVASFLASESYPLVVKPDESAGSEGVKLCHTPQEAKTHFTKLVGMTLMNGQKCAGVLCQEFLRGTEYVVDHVSRNGRHVTTAVWVYDKRPVRLFSKDRDQVF